MFLWNDSDPVSMDVKTRPTRHGASISWVYMPSELRRRGCATSCVVTLSQQLLAAGLECCTLFSDLGNPISNDIYQQVGCRPVCDYKEIRLMAG